MNISSRCEYACRAMVELALRAPAEETITAQTIAERRSIPEKYLVHILLQLKRAGLVKSVRGAQGGYLLGRVADDVTLSDIVKAIDGPILDPLPAEDDASADLKIAWQEVAGGIDQILSSVTVQDILDRASKADMYYI
jgi:Rrf2 family transcriptional regulator, cysteine metabolism repressor